MWEDDDGNQDAAFDPDGERRRVEALPIFQKAEEIRQLTGTIIDSITNEQIKIMYTNTMLEDSLVIPENIAAAEASEDYGSKMEHALLVKMHARSLENQSASLLFDGVLPKEYFPLLRKEIDAFKTLFRQWVSTFKDAPHKPDEWGLFSS